ncbi:MAG: MFS transporter [Candidatus Omnitrophota bacterium]
MISNMGKIKGSLLILSWALYDLANQFFALNVVSLHFPRWISVEKGSPEIFYSLAFGVSMFLVAVFAPFLGALSDMRNWKKSFLVFFTFLSIIFTIGLGLSTGVLMSLVFFAIANFGCQEAIIFYNALMTRVAPRERIGLVSGLGRMFGYSGAILALYLTKPVILNMGYQATFIFTGILFLVFALPCLIFIKEERPGEKMRLSFFLRKERLVELADRLKMTIRGTETFKGLRNFLKASFFMLCVVNALILFMAVYAVRVFGLAEDQIIDLVAFSTLFAILGSIVSGFISDLIGYVRSLLIIFFLWGLCILGGGLLEPPFHWLVGALAGLSLGSTWVVLRALVIKLVPEEKIGEAFGLFNLVSYFSGMVGPLFWGMMLFFLSRMGEIGYRISFLSMMIFIAVGVYFLLKIGRADADEERV